MNPTTFTDVAIKRSLTVNGSYIPAGNYHKAYFVDVNYGSDDNDGLSWLAPYKTLTVAMAASHANIAADSTGWASRNVIYYKGDNAEASTETLVTLAQKTDIIGVGSYDFKPYPEIIGNHVIVGSYMGCRFINFGFRSPAAGGVIMTIPTNAGISFLGCSFDGRSTTPATKGIVATAIEKLSIIGCKFTGKFSTTAIELGTGSSRDLVIKDNLIESGAIGITVNSGLTCADAVGYIINNVFDVVTLFIDDNSDKLIIGGNRGRTQADGTVVLTIDYNDNMAYDNIFAHSAGVSQYPVLVTIPT